MRNGTIKRVLTGVLMTMMLSSAASAQRQQTRTAASNGPWQCQPSDSLRAFSRAVRADSIANTQRGTGGIGTSSITGGTTRSHEFPDYDVVLDIPNLCVNRIFLKVDSVTAKINLNAQVSNLVKISAGADVLIGNVDLTIQGVRAQALLLVDLDDVVYIVDQTLTFIDKHPEVIQQLGSTLQNTVGSVGGLVNKLVLGTVTNAAGQAVQRVVDQATGQILEQTLSTAGSVIAQKAVGSLTSLPVIKTATDAAGNVVKQVRDTSGSIVEYTLSKAGKYLSSRIVQAVTR
jgi:hypothetical protein